eukprot:3941797-Rhodomonas_salina.3
MQEGEAVAYRDEPLFANKAQNGKVALWAACSRVNHHVHCMFPWYLWGQHSHHVLNVIRAKALLQGVKGEPGKLRLDQVGPVRHNGLQSFVTRAALPTGDKVEQVFALPSFAFVFAVLARQLHGHGQEDGCSCYRVSEFE